jgi:aminoglycoside 6'-N-acetyltransferase
VTLRPLREEDVAPLAALGADPSVSRWFPDVSEADMRERLDPEDDAAYFAIEERGGLVGMVQFWEESERRFRHAAIDLFLGAEAQGRGLGTDVMRTMVRYLREDRGHHRLTIDPELANERAIRCYERLGFRRVGVLRSYFLAPDGTWHDGLLMELTFGS